MLAFGIFPLANVTLGVGNASTTNFKLQAPVSCVFHKLEYCQQSSGGTNYITPIIKVNGTAIVTATTTTLEADTVYSTKSLDVGASPLILANDTVAVSIAYGGTAASINGIRITVWAEAKPRG